MAYGQTKLVLWLEEQIIGKNNFPKALFYCFILFLWYPGNDHDQYL